MLNKKCIAAIALAGFMAFSMTACGGSSQEKENKPAEATTEEVKETSESKIDKGVDAPQGLDKMLIPMEALAMENYHLGYPYYVQFQEGSSRDSFWFSTAMTEYLLHPDATERISMSQEECDMIVSALYSSYAQGGMEIPEIRDGVSYVAYDDENGGYFVSRNDSDYVPGSISEYSVTVTSCEASGDGYLVKVNLMDNALETAIGEYQFNMVPSIYAGENNLFPFSISDMAEGSTTMAAPAASNPAAVGTDSEGNATGETVQATDEEGNPIPTEESGEATYDEGTSDEYVETDDVNNEEGLAVEEAAVDSENQEGSVEEVSSDRALEIAKENYGQGAQYELQGVQKLDGYPYYVFTISGDGSPYNYVLVGTNGIDCVAANRNDDGSWTFDQ